MRAKKPSGQIKRKANIKNANPKIIIVCEGETEEDYFDCYVKEMKWASIKVKSIVSSKGSAPISVVNSAIKEQSDEIQSNGVDNKFDNIFCVIDEDTHTTHQQALQAIHNYNQNRIKDKNNKVFISRVYSNPCFEYWLLLHTSAVTKPYKAKRNKSSGDICEQDLKKSHTSLKNYAKTNISEMFEFFKQNISNALKHAGIARIDAIKRKDTNPYTQVDLLITYLHDSAGGKKVKSKISFPMPV